MAAATVPITDQTGSKQQMNVKSDAAGGQIPTFSQDVTLPTYRFSGSAFAMVATPTAAIVIAGAAAKTGRVKRIALGGAATAAGSMACFITRRDGSTGSLGSAVLTAITAGKHRQGGGSAVGDPNANCTVSSVGTANYTTLPTSKGQLGAGRLTLVAIGSAATSGEGKWLVWEFASRSSKSWYLDGANDLITIDFGGAAIPAGGVLDYEIEIEEDNS